MEEQAKKAWASALRLLAATPKTRKELEKKLLDKSYPLEIIRETLDKLEAHGFLSDIAYAKGLAVKLTQGKPSGRRKLSFEMKRRGIPGKIQEEILSGITPEDEAQRAKEIAALKWAQSSKLEPLKRKKKVFDFLMRRGFDYQTVKDALESMGHSDDDNG